MPEVINYFFLNLIGMTSNPTKEKDSPRFELDLGVDYTPFPKRNPAESSKPFSV